MHLLNGAKTDSISLQDRGLQYGDGLFETIALRNGRLEFWHNHMQRLTSGCQRLNIPAPDQEQLLQEAHYLCDGQSQAVLKIIVTRGQGGRGYRAPSMSDITPNRILSLHNWPDYPATNTSSGIVARYCITRLGINPALAGIKHLNRLEQVLARSEWDDESIFEGFMLDTEAHIIEATMSNLFFVKSGRLCTPDLSNCGVAGIMRNVILSIAHKSHISTDVGQFDRNDINHADELFISNSLIGICPVRQLEQQHYSVGPITQALIEAVKIARSTDEAHEVI